MGAFLIDAETRLNPSVAVTYFGANQESASLPSRAPQVRVAAPALAPLSEEDLRLVERQKLCPVTDLALDSMGGPVPVELNGRRVFICCRGCETKLKNDPETYLAKIPMP